MHSQKKCLKLSNNLKIKTKSGERRMKCCKQILITLVILNCPNIIVYSNNIKPLPQPDIIFYGSVSKTYGKIEMSPERITWLITENGDSATISETTFVTVETNVFYISRISFEIRKIVGGQTLPATPNVLELKQTNTIYSRSARVEINGESQDAYVSEGEETFVYGVPSQGLIDRIDLVIGESYNEWSSRIFGFIVDKNEDEDQDGSTNEHEWITGTNPQNADSKFVADSFQINNTGTEFTMSWQSEKARRYRIIRNENLKDNDWQTVMSDTIGNGLKMTYTEKFLSGTRNRFYRILVSE